MQPKPLSCPHVIYATTNRCVVISGCSGGGKSTLLEELARRGYTVFEEPGRRIVNAGLQSQGIALPWSNPHAFLRRAADLALTDKAAIDEPDDWVFFDRGLVDAASGLQHLTGDNTAIELASTHRYHHRVFMAPPWPEIYVQDEERRHSIESAMAEYERLMHIYPALGYHVHVIPKTSVAERADHVLRVLGQA